MNKYKVLRVVTTMNPAAGGVADSVRQSIDLAYHKYQVSIDVLSFDDGENFLNGMNKVAFKHHSISRGVSSYAWNFEYLGWLMKNINSYNLVIFDGLWQFHILGGFISKIKSVPYVVFTHGMLDPYFNENRFKYIKKLPFWFLFERNVLALSKAVVFTTDNEEKKAKSSFPLAAWNSDVCTLGVSPEVGVNYSPDGNVVFLSRIHPKKGLELLISSVSIMSESNLEFEIYGPGDGDYIKSLKKFCVSRSVGDRFFWRGGIWGKDKWNVLSNSSLFVLTSYQENFGIAVAEALSVGVPVLITNNIDISGFVLDYGAGFVVDADPVSIANALDQWSRMSFEDRILMSDRAFICYQECFSIERSVGQLCDLVIKYSRF